MQAYDLAELLRLRASIDRPYLEFLRVPDLSAGLYVLRAGDEDRQTPHSEPELYYVVSGAATVTVGAEDRPVSAGALVFVDAGAPHRFHTITEDLTLLVVFAPAEYARAGAAAP